MIGYFISIFVSIAIMSWALVMMNGGFRVNIHISIDYSWLIILLCVLIGINLIWYYLFMRKNIYFIDKKDSPLITTVGFFFPIILSITLTLMTGLVYFVCNYYLYLCEMKL